MSLKEAFQPYFRIGVAIATTNLEKESNRKLIVDEFNSVTCENNMKPCFFMDEAACKADPQTYDLAPAVHYEACRPFLDFARDNGIPMRGHTLVWHNQTPQWFFYENYDENGTQASREKVLTRLENYIKKVLQFVQTEYPGVIYAWDVCNEAIEDNGIRKSMWTEVVGEDYAIQAFRFARKYADPAVKLYYNDYETALEWKRDCIINLILKPLMAEGLVDGMGMQCHFLMDHPTYELYQTALEMYGALGLDVQMTELDMHNNDPSEASMQALGERYQRFFEIMVEAKKNKKANITAVTFWNLLDENSWLTGFRRETSYPLLFWKDCEKKPAYAAVLKAAE